MTGTTVEVYPEADTATGERLAEPPRDKANRVSPWDPVGALEMASDLRKRSQGRRADRYQLRAVQWRWSDLPRVRQCGRVSHTKGAGVGLRLSDGVAGFAGLVSCGSVWADPVCSSKVLARRGVEIGAMLASAVAQGFVLGFGTFTMRHRRGEALEALWGAGRSGWRRSISGKAWMSAQERCGVVGWVRVWEVTDGRNGWHVHVHWVVVLDPGSSLSTLDDAASGMLRRWSAGLAKHGREAMRIGQEWHLVVGDQAGEELARYVSKLGAEGLGLELTHVQPGRGRGALKTLPVWAHLANFAEDGDFGHLARWHEWEKGSKGARQVGYSKGFRARFGLEQERTDEEIAAEELGTEGDSILWIRPQGWAVMVVKHWRMAELLAAAENGGLPACRQLLDRWGDVEYVVSAR